MYVTAAKQAGGAAEQVLDAVSTQYVVGGGTGGERRRICDGS
jgi:hypothetical protein